MALIFFGMFRQSHRNNNCFLIVHIFCWGMNLNMCDMFLNVIEKGQPGF